MSFVVIDLAQIGKHIRAIVIVPRAGLIERMQIGGSERRGGDGKSNRHIESLLARKTHPPLTRIVRMLIAKSAPTLDALPQRGIVTPMRHQITNHHLTLFSRFFCHEDCAPH